MLSDSSVEAMLEQSSEEFRHSVCQSLGTTLAEIQDQVKTLKDWIQSQPHLPQCASKLSYNLFKTVQFLIKTCS